MCVLPLRKRSPYPAQGRILQILASKNVHRNRHRLAIRAHRAHDCPLWAGQLDVNVQPAPRVPPPLSPEHGVGHARIPRITGAAKPQRHLAPVEGAGPGLAGRVRRRSVGDWAAPVVTGWLGEGIVAFGPGAVGVGAGAARVVTG
jgi:hypothetical protein